MKKPQAKAIRASMLLPYRSDTDVTSNGVLARSSQLYVVLVFQCRMLNSHDQTRDSRQMDKALMGIVTRSYSASIQPLLVDLAG